VKTFKSEIFTLNLPYISETSIDENILKILFNRSSAIGFYDYVGEDGLYDNSTKENSSSNEEQDFEDKISRQQEPLQTTHF